MPERIFTKRTVEALRDCMVEAAYRHSFPLLSHLIDAGIPGWASLELNDPYIARIQLDGLLEIINWTDRDQIRPLLNLFEGCYVETPIGPGSPHQAIDVCLASDGFRIQHGRMHQLVI